MEGASDSRLASILDLSVSAEIPSILPLARALVVLERVGLAPTLAGRIDQLRQRVAFLLRRTRQIDLLGDLNNEPESLFAVLGDEIADLQGYDSDRMRKARWMHQTSRASAAEALFQSIGWSGLSQETKSGLQAAIEDLRERERFESWGLFLDGERGLGIALGIKFITRENGQQVIDLASNEVRKQAGIVASHFLKNVGWEMSIEWPATFAGESIGLPLCVAALISQGDLSRDALLCATGRIDITGNVLGVGGIAEKIEAARRLGMTRVLVPTENIAEANAAASEGLSVIPVGHVRELPSALRQSLSAVDFDFTALSRLVRESVRHYGLHISEEKTHEHGLCFAVGNTSGKVSLWIYSNGRVHAQGAAGKPLEAAQRLIRERVPADPEPRPTKSFDFVSDEFAERSRSALEQLGAFHDDARENEVWRLRLKRGRSTATIVAYSSGKCVLQGNAPAWQLVFDTLDGVLSSVGGLDKSEPEEKSALASSVDPTQPHIGTDEAGKGDYFGPLVSAAVYVDRQLSEQLLSMGVRDSKTLSDRRVRDLSEAIKRVADGKYAVTAIHPSRFNELYAEFSEEKKNLNSLLAWGHARSIDRLLSAPASRGIQPAYVLVDQFADPRHVEERTKRAGIPIHQRPKAESDIAVAAASILAREAFLEWLEKWSAKVGLSLPKGASPEVVAAAKKFVRQWGRDALADVAKLSFRTTKQVLDGEKETVTSAAPPWANDRDFSRDS